MKPCVIKRIKGVRKAVRAGWRKGIEKGRSFCIAFYAPCVRGGRMHPAAGSGGARSAALPAAEEEIAGEEQAEPEVPEDTEEPETEEEEVLQEPEIPQKELPKVKGIYITGPMAGHEGMADREQLAADTELNAMVIDIKNDEGIVTYKMSQPMVEELGAGLAYIQDLPELMGRLKGQELYLIARIVAFKDPLLAEKRPELCIRKRDGSVFRDKNGLMRKRSGSTWPPWERRRPGLALTRFNLTTSGFPRRFPTRKRITGPRPKGSPRQILLPNLQHTSMSSFLLWGYRCRRTCSEL